MRDKHAKKIVTHGVRDLPGYAEFVKGEREKGRMTAHEQWGG